MPRNTTVPSSTTPCSAPKVVIAEALVVAVIWSADLDSTHAEKYLPLSARGARLLGRGCLWLFNYAIRGGRLVHRDDITQRPWWRHVQIHPSSVLDLLLEPQIERIV